MNVKTFLALFYISAALNGILGFLVYETASTELVLRGRIKQLEGEVRHHAGKFLDLEERYSEEIHEAKSNAQLEAWRLQSELETCKKGK